jgi:hypothetical protein
MPNLTFTEEEAREAQREWGCNCGPAALAFALQVKLGAVRHAIPEFDGRRYTSPTMMAQGLAYFGRTFRALRNPSRGGKVQPSIDAMFSGPLSLVRIQWTGPWTKFGSNARWAARQTHWVASWAERGVPLVFDVNCGIASYGSWEYDVVPQLTARYPRADGGWYAANVWRLEPAR